MRILDLFSGAGGLTEGFRNFNDFDIICHVESDKAACDTLRLRNIYYYLKQQNRLSVYKKYIQGYMTKEQLFSVVPSECIENVLNIEISTETLSFLYEQLDTILDENDLDGIIGGPPCQAYSTVGRAKNKCKKATDKRIYLYEHYVSLLKRYRPKFFVFENVKGLLSFKDCDLELLLPKIVEAFKYAGYNTIVKLIDSSDYGVSQRRERLFIIGIRCDLEIKLNFFEAMQVYKECPLPLNELFSDLPALLPGECKTTYKTKSIRKSLKQYYRQAGDVLTYHLARPVNRNDSRIYRLVAEEKQKGYNLVYTKLPKALRTHSNENSFIDRFKALDGCKIAHTIVAHIAKDGHYYIHPDINQNRSISVREAARIQGFPDNFYFESSRSSAFKQIGNAVPPILSKKIAQTILDIF